MPCSSYLLRPDLRRSTLITLSYITSSGDHMADDLPIHAGERLHMLENCFTSDLSVNEFLLVKQAGFEPLGMVVGSSIYHTGYQQRNWSKNEEMAVLTTAMYHARELAMERMEEEADLLKADGVIGVRLEAKHLEFGEEL